MKSSMWLYSTFMYFFLVVQHNGSKMYVRWEGYYNKRSPYTWHDSLFLVLFCLHLSSWEFPFWITNGVVESSRCELVIINAIITVTHNATTMAHWRNASFVKMWIEKEKINFSAFQRFPRLGCSWGWKWQSQFTVFAILMGGRTEKLMQPH